MHELSMSSTKKTGIKKSISMYKIKQKMDQLNADPNDNQGSKTNLRPDSPLAKQLSRQNTFGRDSLNSTHIKTSTEIKHARNSSV